jgi:hypothetical protein
MSNACNRCHALGGIRSRRAPYLFPIVAVLVLLLSSGVWAQEPVSLMGPRKVWTFDNGAEFPGATGGLTFEVQAKRDGRDAIKLTGDFTKGGNYVQAGRKIDKVDVRELSLWVRDPDMDQLTIRLIDGGGQVHQFDLKVAASPEWQQVVFPLEQFFARLGRADAVTVVKKYEYWSGAKDGRWHGPATAIYLLLGRNGDKKVCTRSIMDLSIAPRPAAVPGAEVAASVRLDEIIEGEHDWQFSRGEEFPGAKGSLAVVKDKAAPGQTRLKLTGDFTKGGAYVAMVKELKDMDAKDVPAFRLNVKSDNAEHISVRVGDSTGQTHQARLPIKADGKWQEIVIRPTKIAGGEHWGGANDGKWHEPPSYLALILSPGKSKDPVVELADIRADVWLPVFAQPAAFRADFEGTDRLAETWAVKGKVSIDSKTAFKGSRSLAFERALEAAEQPCSVAGPRFKAVPGKWDVGLAVKSDLHSPDDSFSAVVVLECLDDGGKSVERITLADVFGKHDWQSVSKRVEIPRGVVAARFQIQLNKTHGCFWVDDLSASFLAPTALKDGRVARLLFSTAQMGNLLFPKDSRRLDITVEATKPLRDSQRTLSCVVRDYWGAEQMRPVNVELRRGEKKDGRLLYQGSVDLSQAPLEIGRYYEVHAAVPRDGDEPFRNFTSFAILPEAETKRFKPDEIPFTSRNWDNRFTEYFVLSDRLGLRTCGLWSGWASKAPYKPEAPGIEMCQKLGLGVLAGTPVNTIEQGKKEYDETSLRQGVRTFLDKYGKHRPLTICLGNEPPPTGERVRANVEAYRIVYEEVKKVDPTVFVLGTSVGPEEEYFRLGFGKWCDAYDFHVYGGPEEVRAAIKRYPALFEKYGHAKPIWSTELGLNSQGMTRHEVAVGLIKSFSTFFAAGGANASWFDLLYPDADAKSYGSSGDSHNVFDCRYNRYCPRLDAVAYYNAVNAIAIKKFIEEKHHADGVRAFLFRDRDGRSLQVLWKDKGRQDVFVPLADVKQVQVIRIDGTRRTLNALGKGVTLTVSDDPLLLLYDGGGSLPAKGMDAPLALLSEFSPTVSRGGSTTLTVALNGVSPEHVGLLVPPLWVVTKTAKPGAEGDRPSVRFELTAPRDSSIRALDVTVTLEDGAGNRLGELYHRAPVGD